ncbi:MAG: DUF7344 domain-containing protein [Natronomonas sp.]
MSSIVNTTSREAKNTLFTVLSNHRRRYVLYACNGKDGETTLSDVAEQVAAWEYGKSIDAVTSVERKRVYTSIQQHHLSKLEEADLIRVEGDRIASTDRARNLDVYFEVIPEENIPWAIYYLGLAVIGGFVLGITAVGWLPDVVTVYIASATFVVLLALSSLVHLRQARQMKFDSAEVPPEIDR